ncbi:hypothetical protein M0208_03615 [Sphingomonas sp. SUN019]|uniref:hypothetical protein n=1 Tax=Sphingomonas sp. SUN019 TaxID=2937788 RepID=UPI00216410CE|nr:hypothetical protein [Sphingomonas sp. SUN019]UVO49640.1 hypothetical protein M0208_03615 [Sphingomonas sp. SUN019]
MKVRMGSYRASIRNTTLAATIAACFVLPACGDATPAIAQRKADPMTTTDTASTATQHAAAGKKALDSGDYATANAEFDRAIAAIGDSYVDTKAIDDTGVQLTLAQSKVGKGDLAGAAKVKAQVVRARLEQVERAK